VFLYVYSLNPFLYSFCRLSFFSLSCRPLFFSLFPYTTLFRSCFVYGRLVVCGRYHSLSCQLCVLICALMYLFALHNLASQSCQYLPICNHLLVCVHF